MKNYDQTIESVFERIENYNTLKRKRTEAAKKAVIPLCCICLAVLVGSVIHSNLTQMPIEENSGAMPAESSAVSPAESSEQKSSQSGESQTEESSKSEVSQNSAPEVSQEVIENSGTVTSPSVIDNIVFVDAEEFPTVDRMYIALMTNDRIQLSSAQLNAYYGTNVFPDNIPDDLTLHSEHFFIYRKNNGKGDVYHDGNAIRYLDESMTRGFSINVDKNGMPFDFCNIFAAVDSFSVVNGTKVGFAQMDGGENLLAEFIYQEVGFRIIASGVTQDEFIAVVKSLLY